MTDLVTRLRALADTPHPTPQIQRALREAADALEAEETRRMMLNTSNGEWSKRFHAAEAEAAAMREAICLRTGPVCMCGVEKMRTEILALRVVEQAARQMYLQYTDVEGIPFRTFEELWRGIGRALAALEEKP